MTGFGGVTAEREGGGGDSVTGRLLYRLEGAGKL